MKLKRLLIIPVVAVLGLTVALAGCSKRPKKDTEPVLDFEDTIECLEGQTINLYNYVRAYDEDDGDITKNIEITVKKPGDADVNWCSELKKSALNVQDGEMIGVRYDVCNPFAIADASYSNVAAIIEEVKKSTSKNMTGDEWTARVNSFNDLSAKFSAFMGDATLTGAEVIAESNVKYNAFFDAAALIYDDSLVSFTHNILIDTEHSAVVGINNNYTLTVGEDFAEINLKDVVARLFGYADTASFVTSANALSTACASYRTAKDNGTAATDGGALENGSFYTANKSFVFPIAIRNKMPYKTLTFVIVDGEGRVSVWLNNIEAALWAINTQEDWRTYGKVNNDLYCKNLLFVTGPEVDDFDFDFDFDFDEISSEGNGASKLYAQPLSAADGDTVPVTDGLVTLEEPGTYQVIFKITDTFGHVTKEEAEIVVYERGAVFLDFDEREFDVGSAETGKGGGKISNGKIIYNVEKFGEKDWHNKIWLKDRFSVAEQSASHQIVFSFKAKATKPTIVLLVAPKDGGWDPTLFWEKFTLGELETEYRIVIEADRVSDFNKLEMQFGGWGNSDNTVIEVSDVHFEYMNDSGFNG